MPIAWHPPEFLFLCADDIGGDVAGPRRADQRRRFAGAWRNACSSVNRQVNLSTIAISFLITTCAQNVDTKVFTLIYSL